jgi:hypothetical protein
MRVPRFFKAWAAASQPPALGVHIYVPDLAEKSTCPIWPKERQPGAELPERPAAGDAGNLRAV